MDDRFQLAVEPQRKSQRGMWVAAGCLAAVLVVYHAWWGNKEKDAASVPGKTIAAALNTASEIAAQVPSRQPINWPAIPFDDLIENNPFQPRQAFETSIRGTPEDRAEVQAVERELEQSRAARRKRQALARELSSSDWKVRLLFQSARGAAAVIGDRIVHEGDSVEGYQVVAIDHDGVTLEPLTDADSAGSGGD